MTCEECQNQMTKTGLFDQYQKFIMNMWVCYNCYRTEEYSHRFVG